MFTGDKENIRLVGGKNTNSGRIELLYNDTWSTVCDDGWNQKSASVACKMAGYENGAQTWRPNAAFGEGTGKILVSDVTCTGSETCLFECAHSDFYTHACSHADDVGVVCLGK